jgi:hypothetical protein
MKAKKRKCVNCKNIKEVSSGIICNVGFLCSDDCRKSYGMSNASKMVNKDRIAKQKKIDKDFALKKGVYKLNDIKLRRKAAVTAFNAFIRLRDALEPCISCQRYHTGQYHAGHYKPAGINSALKFNELNVHKQCAPCNNNLSGNLTNYRINLIAKIGIDAVIELENNKQIISYNCEQLKSIEVKYKSKLNSK